MGWMIAAAGALLVVGVFLAVYMLEVEPRWFRIWEVSLPARTNRSPDQVALRAGRLPPLRILHVTDTHFGPGHEYKMDFLKRISRETYDFVFLTGDIIDTAEGLAPCEHFVRELSPRLGTYAVLGGHDYYHSNDDIINKYTSFNEPSAPDIRHAIPNPVDKLRNLLETCDVHVLSDESRPIHLPEGRDVFLVGLRDASVFTPDYEAAWSGVPDNAPTIVLAHSPDTLTEISDRGADLAFFGHTHGGQVRFPFIGAVVTRSQLEGKRARGVFREQNTIFTLNRGIGAGRKSNYRLLCRPEITVLTISE